MRKHRRRFDRFSFYDWARSLHGVVRRLTTKFVYPFIFGKVGWGCCVYKPLQLVNPRYVQLGDQTIIRPGLRVGIRVLDDQKPPLIKVGNNVTIEQHAHLICAVGIVIGDNVSIAPYCAILDSGHPHQDIDDPRKIGDRIEPGLRPIEIGANTLIGFGSVILPNVHIGRNCIIGANSIVTRDVPDCSVAAGNPAVVISKYDHEAKEWIRQSGRNLSTQLGRADHTP